MKKYITIAALLAAGSAFANADVAWDAVKEQYLIETGSWSDGKVTLGGEGFDLSLENWEIELSFNALAGTGANQWGTAAFATGGDSLADWYLNGFQLYVKVDGNINVKGNGINETNEDVKIGEIDTDEVVPLTFKVVRSGDNTTYSLLSGATSLYSETFEIKDWSGKITTLSSSITSDQLEAGWTLATGKLSVVPEPSAFGLLAGLGALALVGTRRRRR